MWSIASPWPQKVATIRAHLFLFGHFTHFILLMCGRLWVTAASPLWHPAWMKQYRHVTLFVLDCSTKCQLGSHFSQSMKSQTETRSLFGYILYFAAVRGDNTLLELQNINQFSIPVWCFSSLWLHGCRGSEKTEKRFDAIQWSYPDENAHGASATGRTWRTEFTAETNYSAEVPTCQHSCPQMCSTQKYYLRCRSPKTQYAANTDKDKIISKHLDYIWCSSFLVHLLIWCQMQKRRNFGRTATFF